MSERVDVLIAGAGPTGLLLAGDLAAAGVSCTVLERRADESNLTRAFAVHARTLETLDARGLADELIATGTRVARLRLFRRVAVDLSRLPSRFPFVLVTPQYHTERLLERRALAHGARIHRGVEVTGLRQDATGVEVDTRADGTRGRQRAGYLVGADGVRSTVRRHLGLAFPGHSAVRSVMLADVRLAHRPPDVLTVDAVGDAFAFLVPFGDGWYRVIAWDRLRQRQQYDPVDFGELREVVRRVLGTDFGMHDPRWMSRLHSDERQVARYRVDRVMLAGDAAHVHSPAGGQGMNTGLQDAANLGWKLAATVSGWAPPGLLDSYHDERHPVGHQVVRTSGAMLRLVMSGPGALPVVRATLAVLGWLRPLQERAAENVSAIGVRYPPAPGAHRLAGRRAPDVPLATRGPGPARLYEALRAGGFVLVAPGEGFGAAAGDWSDRVAVVRAGSGSRTVVLVRPDGYVAWAADDADPVRDAGTLRAALAVHCGVPGAGGPAADRPPAAGPGGAPPEAAGWDGGPAGSR